MRCVSFDTGKELWRVRNTAYTPAVSPVFGGGVVLAVTGHGLAEMLEEFGTRLETVEATGDAINQRIARMRAKFQHQQQQRSNARPAAATDQMSEHSQEDIFQDATPSLQDHEMYDPTIPSDFTDGAPMQPGLESPAPVMPL